MKRLILASAIMLSFVLSGCITPDSANVYKKNEMKTLATARTGVIENIRDVQMSDSTGIGSIVGGVIGGVAAGSNIGGGNGAIISGTLGALLGGLMGNAIETNVTKKNAKELTILMNDNQQRLVVVQDADLLFVVGQSVDVITDGVNARVVPLAKQPQPKAPSNAINPEVESKGISM
ncbi:hypothetical protein HQ393_16315 [Chitinibacter bivalviorum]|uniref:Glycine zipper 2TM domain-containing protein n=2 Tax=Chitinibacter bivalviorum TaxID=2739434 RepID=A0A7H9BNB6_9NEIS|nr:hypothetical protein HQ393_16315 [Chitinibacter bivalviorum]